MANRPVLRLAEAVLLFLFLMLPMMLLLGAAEGTERRPTLLFGSSGSYRSSCCLGCGATSILDERVEQNVASGYPAIATDRAAGELSLAGRQTPLLESAGGGVARVVALPSTLTDAMRRRSRVSGGVNLFSTPEQFLVGLPYAAALLAILGVHEMGHFVVARRHGVDVTWPYFIPVPMGLGTLGAFIQIKSLIKSRRAVFDVGIAGPLAGLCVALPALYIGLGQVAPLSSAESLHGTRAGSSILLAFMYQMVHGGDLASAASATIRLTPVAYAGWIGLVVTALNLLPVGQLDGGHIAYGLFGRRYARAIGIGTFLVMFGLGLTVWPGLLTWAIFIALITGFSHLPALDDITPPDAKRFALGAVAMVLLVAIVLPLPEGFMGLMLDCPYL